MSPNSLPVRNRLGQVTGRRSFWILVAMLASLALIHYATPQVRPVPFTSYVLERHAVERIIFLLPIAGATFAFGQTGGLVILTLSVLIMLPRVFWLSPYPGDALVETGTVAVVGYFVVWMIETQEREKKLRQGAVSQLRAINAVAAIVTESLELEQILGGALDKVLQVMGMEAGLIFLLDKPGQQLILTAHRGISRESVTELTPVKLNDGFCGQVVQSGELMLVRSACPTPCLPGLAIQAKGAHAHVIIPLKSKSGVQGVLTVADRAARQILPEEADLLTAIGNQIGVAVENAQLHQDVARQLQIEQQLNRVAKEITSELKLDSILHKVLQIAEELLGADGGIIALLDRERELVRYPYLHNLPQALANVKVPKGEGLAWRVITTNRPAVIEDYAAYTHAIPAFVEAGVISIVEVPIVSGDQVFGALGVVSLDQAKSFSDRDVAILSGVGRQAGIAIENSYLYENLHYYVQQITRAQEDERKRIARDLHDDTIQALIALSRRLEGLVTPDERKRLPEATSRRIEELGGMADEMIKGVRRFSQDLRPSILDDLGLLPALEGLLASVTERDGLQTRVQVLGERRRFSPEVELTLFRIAQEALNNVRKHAQATLAVITVEFTDSTVQLKIQDNGRGFSPPALTGDLTPSGRLGLMGMYERARLLGGTLEVQSELGVGTRVTVNAPI